MSGSTEQPAGGKRLAGKVILVTGASRGIGRSLAVALGAEGAHLVLVARTVGGLEETDDLVQAAGGAATLVPLDLTQYEGIDGLGAQIFERWGRLDGLVVNHAMLGVMSPLAHIKPEVWETAFALNVTSNWRVLRACEPLLRQSEAGRAVFIGSAAAWKHRPYWGLYAATKAAQLNMALTWAAECEKTNIRVNVVDPGPMRTQMRATAMPGEDPDTLPHPDEMAPMVVDLLLPSCERHGEIAHFRKWAGLD
ncbi:MAG: SDR family NAD(P)-dependent oxidoreductase [Alphaproteobacteria bacterium]